MQNDEEMKLLLETNFEEGIKQILDLYGGLIKIICKNILAGFSSEDIEETVADCVIAFWKSKSNVTKADSIKSYIIGITKKVAYDRLRRAKKAFIYPIDDMEIGINIDMDIELSRSINSQIIQKAILSMPELERDIFIRRYYYCERVKSIAEKLNCPEKKVENILYRYKEKLKTQLIEGGIIL